MIYEFLYCDCIYESGYVTISLHRTLKGAYNAMKKHRLKCFNEWRALPNEYRKDYLDTAFHSWRIQKTEIEE